jgi:hypothetical protein
MVVGVETKTRKTPLMTNCNQISFEFPSLERRKIEASFSGGHISSDGGALFLRQADRLLGLTKSLSRVMIDPRQSGRITHSTLDLLRQRIYGLALGYEDLNDHDSLRMDPLIQSAVESSDSLASSPTLCRFEARADRELALGFSKVLIETFINSFKKAPEELILDFDATDDRVHGGQERRSFHGYYDCWCFLPLYVFCGEQLLVSYLRPSNIDPARHAWAILKLLVQRLRQKWPKVRIIFRGDSGFCRWKMLRWCERHEVKYVVGIAKNPRLLEQGQNLISESAVLFEKTGEKQRHFACLQYKAHSWDQERMVIIKAEHNRQGSNPRFVVSNLSGNAQHIYEKIYCARGEMENRIKEQQLGLFADRTSCHKWWSNQFRLLLSSAAYVLMETIRRVGLKGSEMARAQVSTIRLKLFKIGTIVLKNTRRIRLLMSQAYPYQKLFAHVHTKLNTG